jgi:hypothetical protein
LKPLLLIVGYFEEDKYEMSNVTKDELIPGTPYSGTNLSICILFHIQISKNSYIDGDIISLSVFMGGQLRHLVDTIVGYYLKPKVVIP